MQIVNKLFSTIPQLVFSSQIKLYICFHEKTNYMALINCPECENEVSDKAEKCPECAYPIKDNSLFKWHPQEGLFMNTLNTGCSIIFTIIGLILFLLFYLTECNG